LFSKLDKIDFFDYYSKQMSTSDNTAVLERQLLLQLGDRLRLLRKAQGLGTVEMAKRAGMSRTTLSAVEAGDPGPAIGAYLRVMSVLGISAELALLAGDALQAQPAGTASSRSRRPRPSVQVTVRADDSRHQIQDLQSLALHEEAVRRAREDSAFLDDARQTLARWIASGHSRSTGLWLEWQEVLGKSQWRKVLGRTRRAQELRQASPLTAVLPDDARRAVLAQIGQLKTGLVLGEPGTQDVP
jgi:transcriptional regulator with XRE-family HTH domain